MPVSESGRDSSPYVVPESGSDHVDDPIGLRFLRKLGIDRAVGFAVLARCWQLLTGPVTQLLIVFCFTDIQQGYYYAFTHLLAMQIFVELGLHVVIINVASHEWSGLTLTRQGIEGDKQRLSRLTSLTHSAFRWYAIASVLFMLVVSVFGVAFFGEVQTGATTSPGTFSWMLPWIVLVVLTGLQLALLPLTALLEGCGQLSVINRVRFWQGVTGTVVVWALMMSGAGLWALCGSAAVRLAGELYLVAVRYRQFFVTLRRLPSSGVVDWKDEILPLQWRMAIQGCLLWMSSHLAGLVVLKYHGAAVSGRFGMMWTIFAALQAASLSWVETRRPLFGQLIAQRDYGQLDQSFFRFSRISMGLILVGNFLFTGGVWLMNQMPYQLCERIAERLPSPAATAIFAVALVVMHLAQCTNIYVRAHKKDPYLLPALFANPIVAGLVFWLGRRDGIMGVAIGYFVGVALIQVPLWMYVWARTRKLWHSQELEI